MIENATVNQYTSPATPDADGNTTAATAVTLDVRANLQDVTYGQQLKLGERIKDASGMLRVSIDRVPRPAPGGTLVVTLDRSTAATFVVVFVGDRVHGSQSHFEVFLKNP